MQTTSLLGTELLLGRVSLARPSKALLDLDDFADAVSEREINAHIDSGCSEHVVGKDSDSNNAGASSQVLCKNDSASKIPPIFVKGRETKQSAPDTSPKHADVSTGTKRKVGPLALTQQSQAKRVRALEPVARAGAPLADRLRPQALSEFVGQKHLTNPGSVLMNLLGSGNLGSIILWGPPGCGKTTLSRLLAREADCTFKELSATSSGINDVRAVFEEAKRILALTGKLGAFQWSARVNVDYLPGRRYCSWTKSIASVKRNRISFYLMLNRAKYS